MTRLEIPRTGGKDWPGGRHPGAILPGRAAHDYNERSDGWLERRAIMCGRFTLRTPLKDVVELFDLALTDSALPLDFSESALPPRYNIAPSQQVACVRFDADRQLRTLDWLKWGLIPRWADDPSI